MLHIVAGPVKAGVLLREARWIVETWKLAQLERQESGPAAPGLFAKAHAERLRWEYGVKPPEAVAAPSAEAMTELLGQPGYQHLGREGRVHLLLATTPLPRLQQVYRVVFEKILGEEVSSRPVEVR